jgi:aminopeptidase
MTDDRLSADELTNLVRRVFEPTAADRELAVIVDLPDHQIPDNDSWKTRRRLAAGWIEELAKAKDDHGLGVALYVYPNVHSNNADLPPVAWRWSGAQPPDHVDAVESHLSEPMEGVLASHQIIIAPTEFSTTAPLKVMARRLGFRAATMPGFSPEMVPALRLDYTEVNRRVTFLKDLLDRSAAADFRFEVDGYEGEVAGDPTSSAGHLPVQFGDEVVVFAIENNVAFDIISTGPESDAERLRLRSEPARGNIAELGLGVLSDFGIQPIGVVLLDEKLGLHLAFGRSEHFGGQVGPSRFSRPEAVVHQDHVYLPELQPRVLAAGVVLQSEDGTKLELMRGGRYVIDF